ncbi:hypothetical protein JTB14_020719 [Gonioctena quinquepunctata]|nr:hypothetical protein JTB14_020719 [Gonioctena quinquepunctata]
MRNESDIGKHYERQISALLSLKCLLDENIEDFWIKCNPKGIPKFDDIILHVKYENGQKELFMIQAKHKKADRPVVAKMFQSKQKDFCLKELQSAFKEIIEDHNEFFRKNDINEDTRKFFVLYNNAKIHMKGTSGNSGRYGEEQGVDEDIDLHFEHLTELNFRSFLSTKSFSESTGFKIKSRTQSYDPNFLDNFYFYAEQLNLEEVRPAIEKLSGLQHIADKMIHNFDEFTKPTSEIDRWDKQYVKMLLLSSTFGNFQPSVESTGSSPILDIIKEFDVTIISDDNSENVIWSEILSRMRKQYKEDSLKLSNWQNNLPPNLQELFGHYRTKDLYFRMVIAKDAPLYIKTDNVSYPVFLESMFNKLDVSLVIYDKKKECFSFQNLMEMRVFKTLNDLDEDTFQSHAKNIEVSFKGKRGVPLFPLIENDRSIREKVTVDLFVKLSSNTVCIGVKDDIPDQIYINRTLKIPTITEDVLKEDNILFIICNFPSSTVSFGIIKNIYARISGTGDVFQRFYNTSNINFYDSRDMKEEDCNIITTDKPYDDTLIKPIIDTRNQEIFYILQYVGQGKNGCEFVIIKTNIKRDLLKFQLSECRRKDHELIEFLKGARVNFICNNGGMGKTMLLRYLSNLFSANEWLIHVELEKHKSDFEKVETYNDLRKFFYNSGMTGVDERFTEFSKNLYQHFERSGRLILLVDDCEEVKDPKRLKLFKEATNRGMKLWIVARPPLRQELEHMFETFSMELTEFTVQDQMFFFRKFFQKRGRNKHEIKLKLADIEVARSKLANSFIGICQQTMMLAVVFDTDEENASKSNRIDELYEKFINLKVNEHYARNRQFIIRTLSKLALTQFFSERVLKNIFDWTEFQCDIEVFKNEKQKPALVTYFGQNNIAVFSHKTYAEYLAGRWLAEIIRKQINKETPLNVTGILEILYLQELTNVRLFFDSILLQKDPLGPNPIGVYENDLLGRNIMHISLSYGDRYDIHTEGDVRDAVDIVEVPEDPVVSTPNENIPPLYCPYFHIQKMIREKDTFMKMTPIDCAIATGCLKRLNDLMEKRPIFFSSDSLLREDRKYYMLVHCIRHNLNAILRRICNGKDEELLKVRDSSTKKSLLHMAVRAVNLEAVRILLDFFPVEKWGTDGENNTPLHLACQKNNKALDIFHQSEITGDFLNLKNKKGFTHLHCVVLQGNLQWTRIIINCSGIEIDAKCSFGNTPLMLSFMNNKPEIASLLKGKGANINHKNKRGMTALHFTASKGLFKGTQQLIKWGADLDQKNSFGATPLISAAIKGNAKIVKSLLFNRADINAFDSNKWTALHHATKRKNIDIVKILLEENADVDSFNKKMKTPLMIACLNDVPKAAEMLLDHHADVNVRSDKGLTAMEISVREKHKSCIDVIKNKIRDRHDRKKKFAKLAKISKRSFS